MSLSYKSALTYLQWRCTLKAARLVPNDGSSAHLPSPIGEIPFIPVTSPERYGIAPRHPLQSRYPDLVVLNFFMVIKPEFLVERNGIPGVALYADYNGSDLCASVTSENGLNPLAPWDWKGANGTLKDPTVTPYLEWREMMINSSAHSWQNHMLHGWPGWSGQDRGLDWRDGTPETLATMYDRQLGRVGQSIMVPYEIPGLGAAEQTLSDPADVMKTYSILVFFPETQAATKARQLTNLCRDPYDHIRRAQAFAHETLGSFSRGAGEKGGGIRAVEQQGVSVDFKMATGGWIGQHIIRNPFGRAFWSPVPEVLFVCWPISQSRANELLLPASEDSRRTF